MRGVCESAAAFTGRFGPIEIIFDEHKHFRDAARWSYRLIQSTFQDASRYLPAEPWFRNDAEFLPLQAADLVASSCRFALNEHGLQIGTRDASEQPPDTIINVKLPNSEHSRLFTRERLKYIGDGFAQMIEAWEAFAKETGLDTEP